MVAPIATLDREVTAHHRAAPDVDELALERSIHGWEIAACRALIAFTMAASVMVLAISPWIGEQMALAELALTTISIAHMMLMRRGLERFGEDPTRRSTLNVLRWSGVTLEVSFASFAVLIALRMGGEAWAATSPISMIYGLAMVAAAFRLRGTLALYAAGLACAQWLLIYHFAIAPGLEAEELRALPTLGAWAAWERAFWIGVIGGLLALMASRLRALALASTTQVRLRKAAVQELGRMVSPDVAERALSGELVPGASERKFVTVLFCDLRDFTALCEHRRAEDALSILNAFYERACFIIRAHGGHVNKFLGDGVLALFGAPEPLPHHARAAVECARQLARAADELRAQGGVWDELQIGVGLDTGDVVLGAVGSSDRLEYTAIGATVNRAARLQALTASTGRRIVLSARTATELDSDDSLLPLGEARIKGVDRPVRIYTPR